MEYILAKDNTLGKKGDPVYSVEWGKRFRPEDSGCFIESMSLHRKIYIGELTSLLRDGWIEEVKKTEMEIWISKYNREGRVWYGDTYESEADAEKYEDHSPSSFYIGAVRLIEAKKD